MNDAHHLTQPPSAAFWLGELGFARFPGLLPLLDEPDTLRDLLGLGWAGPTPSRVLGAIREEHGDQPAQALHMLLVSEFLQGKKSAAVRDVAHAHLGRAVRDQHELGHNGVHRLAAAGLLYLEDPRHLLAIEACHRWHSSRRSAMELAGPLRKPPLPLVELDWSTIGPGAVEDLPAPLQGPRRPRFELSLPRAKGREVLLGFRVPADYAAVRDPKGKVRAGRLDRWLLLRFHREALRVDVSARDQALGVALADAVANRIWSVDPPLRYRPADGRLTAADLQAFLERLRDPEDDTFQLLEITALAPALAERPEIRVGAPGQARAEPALEGLRQRMAFAERWDQVRQAKVGFGGRYRVTVQFPAKGETLRLTYSDAERDKDACQQFERMFREELGVRILPRAPQGVRHREPAEPRRPSNPGPATWARLLAPVVEQPARWEAALLREQAEAGLVQLGEHSVLRCGDEHINRAAALGGRDTLDCPGEIEMPFGALDPDDPFRQEDDAEFTCSVCGQVWHPGRYRLELAHRLRVRIDHGEAWGLLLEAAGKLGRFDEEAPGVASGMVAGQRSYLVYLPLAGAHWHEPGALAAFRGCWVGAPGAEGLERYGEGGLDLSEHLGDAKALERRLTREVAGGYPVAAPSLPALAAAPRVAQRAVAQTPTKEPAELPQRVVISLDAKGVWVGSEKVASRRATGLIKLLALLQAEADEDEAAGRERRFRTAEQLRRRVEGLDFGQVQTWVSRGRKMLDQSGVIAGLGAMVIEGGKGGGYRLGGRFWCVGFEV